MSPRRVDAVPGAVSGTPRRAAWYVREVNIGIRRRSTLAGLVLLLVATACSDDDGGAATSADTARPAPSVATETYQGEGFEMLLPAGWLVATPGLDIGALLEESGEIFSPSGAEAFERQVTNLFRQGGRLFAFDPASAHPDFIDNINIISMPAGGSDAARIESVTVQELENRLGAVSYTHLTLPTN